MIFRYRNNTTATITASRCFGPLTEGLTAYCDGGVLDVNATRCSLRDRDGQMIENFEAEETPGELFGRMIDAFVESEGPRYPAGAGESLLTMATVAAAYLSDQTNQPELPARMLRSYDVTIDDCLKTAPIEEARHEAD